MPLKWKCHIVEGKYQYEDDSILFGHSLEAESAEAASGVRRESECETWNIVRGSQGFSQTPIGNSARFHVQVSLRLPVHLS